MDSPVETRSRPVLIVGVVASSLLVVWARLDPSLGGDLAAQYAWASFARLHPTSAYDLAWYGGMHPVSYSALSPYVMAFLGVRTTMVLSGIVSAGLLAHLLVRSESVRRPLWPALYGTLALTANAVSGRATFSLGTMFGLAAVTVVVTWPNAPTSGRRAWSRGLLAAALSALAAAASPVAGLFVGIAAGALWLGGRRTRAYVVGLPPLVVVAASAWLFPFSGRQPMHLASAILPVGLVVANLLLLPRSWTTVRIGSALYGCAVIAAWAVPSPVGSNIVRLGLVFGGIPLVALAADRANAHFRMTTRLRRRSGWAMALLALAIGASTIWQVSVATSDAIGSRPDAQASWTITPLAHQLQARGAALGRTEAVPTKNHQEAAALAGYVNLARGWNRQADAERNPLFYGKAPLTASTYRAWLDTWAVHFVVVSTDRPDPAAEDEEALVTGGLPYLHPVWTDRRWTLYRVDAPAPVADPPAEVVRFTAAGLELRLPRAATVLVRIPYSPWLSLVDPRGRRMTIGREGCFSAQPSSAADQGHWLVLHAQEAGTYRIAAPYALPRGTPCVGR
ncbi:MFS transporter [Marmoricola sp. URHA0025 HA25]